MVTEDSGHRDIIRYDSMTLWHWCDHFLAENWQRKCYLMICLLASHLRSDAMPNEMLQQLLVVVGQHVLDHSENVDWRIWEVLEPVLAPCCCWNRRTRSVCYAKSSRWNKSQTQHCSCQHQFHQYWVCTAQITLITYTIMYKDEPLNSHMGLAVYFPFQKFSTLPAN